MSVFGYVKLMVCFPKKKRIKCFCFAGFVLGILNNMWTNPNFKMARNFVKSIIWLDFFFFLTMCMCMYTVYTYFKKQNKPFIPKDQEEQPNGPKDKESLALQTLKKPLNPN